MSWVSDTCDRITSLRGRRIEHASVVEMALVDHGPNDLPIFRHPAAPFVQATSIELALDGGCFAQFSNYQNDSDFPISMDFLTEASLSTDWVKTSRGEPSIYRLAPNPNFPLGLITAAEPRLNANGDISEVAISVDSNAVLLRAGEVIEHPGNTFAFCDLAGSILLFLHADARLRTTFDERLNWG